MDREIQRPPRKRTCFRRDAAEASTEEATPPAASYLTRLLQSPVINVSGDKARDAETPSGHGQQAYVVRRDANQGPPGPPCLGPPTTTSAAGGPAWESFIHEMVDRVQGGATALPNPDNRQPKSGHLLKFYMKQEDPISHYMDQQKGHSVPGCARDPGDTERGSSTIEHVQSASVTPPDCDLPGKPSARQALIKHLSQSISAKNYIVTPGHGNVGPLATSARSTSGNVHKEVGHSHAIQKADIQSLDDARRSTVTPGVLDLSLPRPKPDGGGTETSSLSPPLTIGNLTPSKKTMLLKCKPMPIDQSLYDVSLQNLHNFQTRDPELEAINRTETVISGVPMERTRPSSSAHAPLHACTCERMNRESSAQGHEWESTGSVTARNRCEFCRNRTGTSCAGEREQSDVLHSYAKPGVIYLAPADVKSKLATPQHSETYVTHAAVGRTPEAGSVDSQTLITPPSNVISTSSAENLVADIEPPSDSLPVNTSSKSGEIVQHQVYDERISLASMTEYFVDIAIRKGVTLNDA